MSRVLCKPQPSRNTSKMAPSLGASPLSYCCTGLLCQNAQQQPHDTPKTHQQQENQHLFFAIIGRHRMYLANVLSGSPMSSAALARSVFPQLASHVSTFSSRSSFALGITCIIEFVVPGGKGGTAPKTPVSRGLGRVGSGGQLRVSAWPASSSPSGELTSSANNARNNTDTIPL